MLRTTVVTGAHFLNTLFTDYWQGAEQTQDSAPDPGMPDACAGPSTPVRSSHHPVCRAAGPSAGPISIHYSRREGHLVRTLGNRPRFNLGGRCERCLGNGLRQPERVRSPLGGFRKALRHAAHRCLGWECNRGDAGRVVGRRPPLLPSRGASLQGTSWQCSEVHAGRLSKRRIGGLRLCAAGGKCRE
jgi:hypothetical protein